VRIETNYLLAADVLLATHTLIVLFIVLGLPLILFGGWRKWRWVRNPWFRLIHLGAIGIVIAQALSDSICPLTRWEMELRLRGGDPGYEGSFVAHWFSALIYYDAPAWAFIAAYTLFGIAVAYAWLQIRPRKFKSGNE
jgi:hypothetical protein